MTTETPQNQLNVVDIRSAVAVINYAAEQGAFRGWPVIEQVLSLKQRLENFLAVVDADQKASEEAAAEQSSPNDPTSTSDELQAIAPGA